MIYSRILSKGMKFGRKRFQSSSLRFFQTKNSKMYWIAGGAAALTTSVRFFFRFVKKKCTHVLHEVSTFIDHKYVKQIALVTHLLTHTFT